MSGKDMEIIYAVFAGSGIREGFGKYSAVTHFSFPASLTNPKIATCTLARPGLDDYLIFLDEFSPERTSAKIGDHHA
jgi:hypothetical protein